MTDQELQDLLKQLEDAKAAGGYELPPRGPDSGVDPNDLEAAKTGMIPSRAVQFGGADGSVRGSAEPGSVSTPTPDPTTPAPKALPGGVDSNDEIGSLLGRLDEAQKRDRRQAFEDRASAYSRLAGGAMSTQMGGLPEVHVDIPGIPSAGKQVEEYANTQEKLRTGASGRRKTASGIQLNDQKLDLGDFKLEDLGDQHNPDSQVSRMVQNAAADALRQSGQDPSIVYHMTAQDISTASPQMKLIAQQAVAKAVQEGQDSREQAREANSRRNTDVMARAGLAGRALGAAESSSARGGDKDYDNAQKQAQYDVTGLHRNKPVTPEDHKKTADDKAIYDDVTEKADELIAILKRNPRPIPGTTDAKKITSDFMHIQGLEQPIVLGGIMRAGDMPWMREQSGDPKDLLTWLGGGGADILKNDVSKIAQTLEHRIKSRGYDWGEKPNQSNPSRGDYGGGGQSGPLQDPNTIGGLADFATKGTPAPALRSPRRQPPMAAPQPPAPPEQDAGTPDIPTPGRKETLEERMKRLGM